MMLVSYRYSSKILTMSNRQSIADSGIRFITSATAEFTNSEFLQTVIPA
jgi:hypothetical protein